MLDKLIQKIVDGVTKNILEIKECDIRPLDLPGIFTGAEAFLTDEERQYMKVMKENPIYRRILDKMKYNIALGTIPANKEQILLRHGMLKAFDFLEGELDKTKDKTPERDYRTTKEEL